MGHTSRTRLLRISIRMSLKVIRCFSLTALIREYEIHHGKSPYQVWAASSVFLHVIWDVFSYLNPALIWLSISQIFSNSAVVFGLVIWVCVGIIWHYITISKVTAMPHHLLTYPCHILFFCRPRQSLSSFWRSAAGRLLPATRLLGSVQRKTDTRNSLRSCA